MEEERAIDNSNINIPKTNSVFLIGKVTEENAKMWNYINHLEFILETQTKLKKRETKIFKKRLRFLSKVLAKHKIKPTEVEQGNSK